MNTVLILNSFTMNLTWYEARLCRFQGLTFSFWGRGTEVSCRILRVGFVVDRLTLGQAVPPYFSIHPVICSPINSTYSCMVRGIKTVNLDRSTQAQL